jgi:adenylate cyclase
VIPGVDVHAQLLEQALTDGFLYRPAWALAVEVLALVLGSLLVGACAFVLSPVLSSGVAVSVVGLLLAGGWRAFSHHQLLLDPLTPALAMVIAFVVPSLLRYHQSEQRRRWVAGAFSRYVSPNLVAHILEHPEQLELGGRRQVCSFVFTDLAGFTTLMEKIEPSQAVSLLNAYLDRMVAIAFEHQGTLDRIVGDAVAVMFSAPVRQDDHQQRAFDCAVAMQRFAARFAQEQQELGIPFGHTRIGVHTGEVTVGNFGGNTMFDYRALGDAVNTASRLENINKQFGTRLCVSQATLDGCTPSPVRLIGHIVLSGKTESLRVFHPWNDGLPGDVDAKALKDYETAYGFLQAGAAQARDAFESLAMRFPADPLVRFHLTRLRAGAQGDVLVFTHK